ncbi:MAG: mannose-6-phosphate isomerase, class I, partial [Spirochaetaceae bacterium]|nr:mannose-6-phosphate isomerase, class I [Spirochaetaceae bacterium]
RRMIYKLENTIQEYAWGSAVLMPEFLGRPNPGKKPWAELWMGAHPRGPSRALSAENPEGAPLDKLIAEYPAAFLGAKTAEAFGALPFLFKVLAAGSPLSIQCHPGLAAAAAGFERENRAGIPPDAGERNYRDANHKPEIILALTPFSALCGLRPVEEIVRFFSSFPVPALAALAETLSKNPHGEGLKVFLRSLLAASSDEADTWIQSIKNAGGSCGAGENLPEFRSFLRLAGFFPGDPGCLAPFYLNLVNLEPGEALFLGPGELHAYLEGLGMELMANSDNVLRAGLTPKHIDIAELFSVASFRAGKAEILRPRRLLRGSYTEDEYPRRADEFALSVLKPEEDKAGNAVLETEGPEILFCGSGSARVQTEASGVSLSRGESLFIPASEKTYTLTGNAVLYRARVPA